MPSEPDLLFVYGTLRPGLATGEPLVLVRGLEHVDAATVRGILYDLGAYPGMRLGEGVVHGDVLRISEPAVLEAFDRYEECGGACPLFQRVITHAVLCNGSEVPAWVYLYNRPVTGAARIESGDYALQSPEQS